MLQGEKFYLTIKGLAVLKKEYKILRELRINKTKKEAPKILESEDLNPEYLAFREDLSSLESRLVELENIFKNVELIKTPLFKNRNIIDLGATVKVKVDGQEDEFTIVGTLEANPALGKISNESPVGSALIGHREGDEVIVSSPTKTIYRIKEIKYQKS